MVDNEFYITHGEEHSLRIENLRISKAESTYKAIQKNPAFTLRKIYIRDENGVRIETIIVDIELDLPQVPKYQFLPIEPLAIVFKEKDSWFPEIFSLRTDFPQAPHLNLTPNGIPRSLCVYADDFSHVELYWTAEDFLNRICLWFEKNSRGVLHQPDQPLEPFFLPGIDEIIIPADFRKPDKNENKLLVGTLIERKKSSTVLLEWCTHQQFESFKKENKNIRPYHVFFLRGNVKTHGIISNSPTTIASLNYHLKPFGLSLVDEIRAHLIDKFKKKIFSEKDGLILLIELPQKRNIDSKPERIDFVAFMVDDAIKEIGQKIDALYVLEGKLHPIELLRPSEKSGKDIGIKMLNPILGLTPERAALLSGISMDDSKSQFVLIGAGSLGSHLLNHFVRMGFGRWSVIDSDHLLPHNTARHILNGFSIGFNKADGVNRFLSTLYSSDSIITSFQQDFLSKEEDKELVGKIAEADAVIDVSASLPVERKIAIEILCKRAISVFLTPSGLSSVLLVEDSIRRNRLDGLEAQYLRWVISTEEGKDHLKNHMGFQRYGGSCREISSLIPNDLVGLHSSILSQQVRASLKHSNPQISMWNSSADGSVSRVDVIVHPQSSINNGDWTIIFDEGIINKLSALRKETLPNETGGILLGYFDTRRKRIYIVDGLEPPRDSKNSPTHFIRGFHGLSEKRGEILNRSANIVDFVGDWHSHPAGVDVKPSRDDLNLLKYNAQNMGRAGVPGVILIIGDKKRCNWLVEELV